MKYSHLSSEKRFGAKSVDALKKMDYDRMERACAASLSEPKFESFQKAYPGLTLSKSNCVMLLVGRHDHGQKWGDCSPPGNDHGMLYNVDGKPKYYISQPYDIHHGTMAEMVDFAKKHGLRFMITGASWHFPGRTVLVIWEKKNV